MKWLLLLLIITLIHQVRNQWPIKGLYYINSSELKDMRGSNSFILIDIRESIDYYENHLEDSIHIFVGRLPYVWANHIQSGDDIVLLGSNRRAIRKAARVLREKAGVDTKIFAHIFTPDMKEGRDGIDGKAEVNHCIV